VDLQPTLAMSIFRACKATVGVVSSAGQTLASWRKRFFWDVFPQIV
jgi:ribosomal protein L2